MAINKKNGLIINAKKDITKKELIKILETIDAERANRDLKKYSGTKKEFKEAFE